MLHATKLKTALLAAASLGAASVATADATPAYTPAPIEHAAVATIHEEPAKPAAIIEAKRWTFAAASAAALAALFAAIGPGRVMRTLDRHAPLAASAVRKVAAAPAAAAKSVARALKGPFRYAIVLASLGFFALTGIGLYDVEWIGGLVAGLALALVAAVGGGKFRRAFAPVFGRNRRSVDLKD
jgi:hypothetical protein